MRLLIQRVLSARVIIEGQIYSEIEKGLLVFLGIHENDSQNEIEKFATKILNMRIFNDLNGKMNLSLNDIQGNLLIVSQFTLYADTQKGNRPSFIDAAKPIIAIPIYEKFIGFCKEKSNLKVQTGIFGADMKIELLNDGPVTIWLDSDKIN